MQKPIYQHQEYLLQTIDRLAFQLTDYPIMVNEILDDCIKQLRDLKEVDPGFLECIESHRAFWHV